MPTIEKANFQLRYDGPALVNNLIDVQDLVPALSGMSTLLGEADFVLNKGNSLVTALVSPFESGSFGIDFTIVQQCSQQVIAGFYPILHVLSALGFKPKDGLIWVIRQIKGRMIKAIQEKEKNFKTLILEDGESIEGIPKPVADLLQNRIVRKAMEKIVADPLSKAGITEVNIDTSNVSINNVAININIGKDEKDYFVAPPEVPQIEKAIQEKTMRIVSAVFEEDYKWKLADGDSKQFYDIQDIAFIRDVESRKVQFAAGDSLRVRLCTMTEIVDGRPRTRFEIIRVLEVIKPLKQQTLG
jgi:hypothetical protein